MKRASKRIILTSERINDFGFRVLTDGVDTTHFEKNNPVLLWMHNRAFGNKEDNILPLGNVVELQRENHVELGKIITGLPVFDDTDDFAMRIYNKYENGTIRMGSCGLRPVEWSTDAEHLLPGQRCATLTKSIMDEFSLCDIGSNDDAVQIALYNDSNELIKLSVNGENATIPLLNNPLIQNEMSKIELTAAKAAVLLGLTSVSSVDEFETKIIETVQLANRQKTQIESLTKEKGELQTKLDNIELAGLKDNTTVMLSAAVEARRITKDEVPFYEGQITDKASFDKVKLHLEGKPAASTVEGIINLNSRNTGEQLAGRTWKDLDKSGDLVQLKSNNFPLFKELFKSEFGKEYGS